MNVFMCANILRYNHTPVKTPINIHKEAPLIVVILIVRHCEEKSLAVLVVFLMCDGFDQKSVTLTLLAHCGREDLWKCAIFFLHITFNADYSMLKVKI